MSLIQSVLTNMWAMDFYSQLVRASAEVASRRTPKFERKTVKAQTQTKTTAKPLAPIEKVYLTTQELLQPGQIDYYKQKGLLYLRRRHVSFRESLRNPTLGCHIELLRHQEPCSYPLDSVYAKKLLRKLCY